MVRRSPPHNIVNCHIHLPTSQQEFYEFYFYTGPTRHTGTTLCQIVFIHLVILHMLTRISEWMMPEHENESVLTHRDLTLDIVKKILTESTLILCKNLQSYDLLLELKGKEALTEDDCTRIDKKDTNTEKIDKLLEILKRSPVSSYEALMSFLQENRNDRPKDVYAQVKAIEDKYVGKGHDKLKYLYSLLSERSYADSQVKFKKLNDILACLVSNWTLFRDSSPNIIRRTWSLPYDFGCWVFWSTDNYHVIPYGLLWILYKLSKRP